VRDAGDAGVVGVVAQAGVELGDGALGFEEELVAAGGGEQDVVGGDAGLAGVVELAGHDAAGRQFDGVAFVEEGGAFAAELEGDGGEVFGGRAQDQAADAFGAGEEQVIEGEGDELAADLGAAGEDAELFGAELLGDEGAEDLGGFGGALAGLEEDAVAGGEGADGGGEGEQEGVVPGADDADDAEGLIADLAAGGPPEGAEGGFAGLHPAEEVRAGVADFVEEREEFEGLGFLLAAAAEVLVDGLDQFAASGGEGALEAAEAVDAGVIGGGLGAAGPVLHFEDSAKPHASVCHTSHSRTACFAAPSPYMLFACVPSSRFYFSPLLPRSRSSGPTYFRRLT